MIPESSVFSSALLESRLTRDRGGRGSSLFCPYAGPGPSGHLTSSAPLWQDNRNGGNAGAPGTAGCVRPAPEGPARSKDWASRGWFRGDLRGTDQKLTGACLARSAAPSVRQTPTTAACRWLWPTRGGPDGQPGLWLQHRRAFSLSAGLQAHRDLPDLNFMMPGLQQE